jgi:CheY-like chemotaxis protein
VRNVMQGMLDILGYNVSICCSGVEAISFLQEQGAEIDYIFCDLKMGGLQGSELFERIFDIAPCIQLILMSGRIESDEVEEFRRQGVCGFLSKPFSIEHLRSELARLAGL